MSSLTATTSGYHEHTVPAQMGSAGLTAGRVVYFSGASGAIAGVRAALATSEDNAAVELGVLKGRISDGAAPGVGDLCAIQLWGLQLGLAGAPAVGDPVYLSDTGVLSLSPGTFTRVVGRVVATHGGATYDVLFSGAPFALQSLPSTSTAKYLPRYRSATYTEDSYVHEDADNDCTFGKGRCVSTQTLTVDDGATGVVGLGKTMTRIRRGAIGAPGRTITLPDIRKEGLELYLVDQDGSAAASNITVQPGFGGTTIQGGASFVMSTNHKGIHLVFDFEHMDWNIIAQF